MGIKFTHKIMFITAFLSLNSAWASGGTIGSANDGRIQGNAQCSVQLVQHPQVGTINLAAMRREINSHFDVTSTIPQQYNLNDILQNKYEVKSSHSEKLNTTISVRLNYAPVDQSYAGSNQATINVAIDSKDAPECNEEYALTLSVGSGNSINFQHALPKSCKAWEIAWIQCGVYASDSAK